MCSVSSHQVGYAFTYREAEEELDLIASDPDSDFKFKVDNFDVLDKIRKTLENNIIAIEGRALDLLQDKLEVYNNAPSL